MDKRLDIFEEIKRIKQERDFFKKQANEWKNKYYEVEKRLNQVESVLNRILNSNTPSSQLPFTEKNTNISPNRNEKGKKSRGKPKGGNGGTKPPPKIIDKKLNAKAYKCDGCGSHNLKHDHTEEIPIWDLPIIKMIVILFYRYIYTCKDCGKIVYGTHPELPKEGMIGIHLAAFLTEIRQTFAGSYGKLSNFLYDLTGETFSGQGIKNCIKRISSKLEPSYKEMEEKLSKEPFSHIDETNWPIGGDKYYLWLFVTLNFVFIHIIKSRARKVVTSILGDFYDGVIISDCLKVYLKCAKAFQKCWAHLLRKTYWLKEKNPKSDICELHRLLSDLYEEAEKYRKSKLDKSERIWIGIILNQKLQRIRNYNWKSEESKGIIKNWLKLFKGHWIVGVFMPEIELTNNKDERGIRKVIPTRKMLGGHRTKEGAKDFAILESHRQTWKLHGKSPYNELVDFLVKDNMKHLVV